MTESGTTEEQTEKPEVHSFGERLYAARTNQGLSAEEVAKAINLTVDIIEAIDHSDVSRLPQPAFVQGYIRVYARQVGVPENGVLDEYSRAVPHKREAVLRPRSALPDETTSGSPLVKIVSMLLLTTVVLAVVYGLYSYYSEIADTFAPGSDDLAATSLELPYMEYPLEESDVSAEIEPPFASYSEEAVAMEPELDMPAQQQAEAEPEPLDVEDTATRGLGTERAAMIKTRQEAPGDDVLALIADEPSWVEVVDANGIRLQYDLVQNGRNVTLRGTAPFSIFLGNAPAMTVRVNDVEIDMTKYVRSNNIAHFKVSVSGSQVIFH